MKTEEEIKKEIESLKYDIDHTDCSKREYCRAYAMIEILEWVLED